MNIIIFEDYNIKYLQPFSINHASFELKCGTFTNLDRIINSFSENNKFYLIVRDEIKELIQEKFPKHIVNPKKVPQGLYLNGAAVWNSEIISKIKKGYAFSSSGSLVSFISSEVLIFDDIYNVIDKTSKVTSDIEIDYITYLWDCIDLIDKYLAIDKDYLSKEKLYGKKDFEIIAKELNIILVNGYNNIFITKNCIIEPGTIIDSSSGTIIMKNCKIESGSIIKGPTLIEENTVINNGAKLKGNVLIGSNCKIGGEISSSIFCNYSNKQHDGFIGNSFVGEWVNIGANVNNSNLKNNYGLIKFQFNNSIIDTSKIFLGVMIGDYSRIGISTMINTGSYIGLGANVYGGDFQKKYLKSFSWGREDVTDFNKFIQTITIMKSRRNKKVTDFELLFLKEFHSLNSK